MSWRSTSDWAKKRPAVLRLADSLGRGRGGMRMFDHVHSPPAARVRPKFTNWEQSELSAAWIGHATVLLRIGEMTILTDPVFSTRVGLGLGLITGGPRRYIAPAVSLSQLPQIDLVLISHAHFDHLDRPTLAKLRRDIPVITAHRTADLIRDLGFGQITELRWGESKQIGDLKVTARPVLHWGARTFYDRFRGFNGYLIESSRRRVLYGGDTAYQEEFKDLSGVDLAIMGIGAYDPFIAAHATPEQVWTMADHCRAERLLPMHHSTFRLSHEPMQEPIERMLAAAGRTRERIIISEVGQQWEIGN
jgi:L-ascorbate metabolism protein UlaG (beta-lactamase superfamily)